MESSILQEKIERTYIITLQILNTSKIGNKLNQNFHCYAGNTDIPYPLISEIQNIAIIKNVLLT